MDSGLAWHRPCMAYLQGPVEEFTRLDPVLGQVASRAPACKATHAAAAANAAAAAFAGWSATAPQVRRQILLRAAGLVTDWSERISQVMLAEIGASRDWVEINLRFSVDHLEEAAALVSQVTGHVSQDMTSMALREPVGVCLAIAPWNAPLVLAFRAIGAALACGNTVVLKASELSPATHLMVGEILAEAGLPEGVLNIVTHAPEDAEAIVERLVSHQAVRRVNFTGSTRVGRMIAETAARHLKRCLLELGGKAPLIVLEDADLEAAAEAATFGAFVNQGQVCMSTDRIVVLEAVADRFAALLTARAERLRAGDPRNGTWALGPVASSQTGARLAGLVADATAKGAALLCGGTVTGALMDATVLDHVQPGMAVYDEECFGPIVSICRASSEEEAIFIANDTDYGLSAAVFGRDTARALRVARRIESGICHINAATLNDQAHMPFGGVKDSGYGRFGGMSAIDEFTETRWITINAGHGKSMFGANAPPGEKGRKP